MKLRTYILCVLISISSLYASGNTSGESPDSTRRIPTALTAGAVVERPPRLLMLKTNAIPWAATILNIEPEIQVAPNITVALPIWYCPWFIAERRSLRVAAFQPEGRWWLKKAGEGHFGGLHASLAWYNLKWGDYRYQDQGRPLLGAGITYGYAFRFGEKWGVELSIGAGYMNLRYDRFYNTHNGQLADTRRTSYFGLDHLAISLVYNLEL